MYVLLSPKGNFLSCSKLMYLFVALDSICAAQSQAVCEQHTAQSISPIRHREVHLNSTLWIYIWKVCFMYSLI